MPVSPTPEERGLSYILIAAISRKAGKHGRHIKVAEAAIPKVTDEIAMEWILEAAEKGLDVGRPRDIRGKERQKVARR